MCKESRKNKEYEEYITFEENIVLTRQRMCKIDRLTQLRIFPNSNVEAYYDPLTISVCMVKYNRANEETYQENISFKATLAHEKQHWCDHIFTYFGLKSSLLAYNAIHAWESQREENFWRIPLYFSNLHSNTLRSYFSEVYSDETASYPHDWRWTVSSGLRFNSNGHLNKDKTITFVRFENANNHWPVARVPLTMESFLEVRAISSEIISSTEQIQKLKNANFVNYNIEKRKMEQSIRRFYNSNLLVYSVLAHMVSTILNIKDGTAFIIASEISLLMLNLSPSIDLANMKVASSLRGGTSTQQERLASQIKSRDCGFIFYNTLLNYAESKVYSQKNEFLIEDYLAASNLPSIEKWNKYSLEDIVLLKQEITDGSYKERFNSMIDFAKNSSSLFESFDVNNHPCPFSLYFGDDLDWTPEQENLREVFSKCECFFSVCTI